MLRTLAILSGLLWIEAASAAEERRACPSVTIADRVTSVSEAGDLELASGPTARLLDIRFADDPAQRRPALAWLRRHVGEAVVLKARPADRWGRMPVEAALARDPSLDWARGMVTAGLAMVDAGEAEALCRVTLLQAEAEARREGLGLWHGTAYRPLAADAADLGAHIGRFVLVEGRIASVGERDSRTYLNFGRRWSDDFTVVLPKQTWATLMLQGHSAASLRGQRVRARGLLEAWNGTAMTIHAAEMIELLPLERRRSSEAREGR